jgi:acetyl esterase/lipase
MAPRTWKRWTAGIALLGVVAGASGCGHAEDAAPPATTLALSVATYPTETTVPGGLATVTPSDPPPSVQVTRDVAYSAASKVDVYAPRAAGPHPTVVIFPGRRSTKATVSGLAGAAAELGAVVFAVDYRGIGDPSTAVVDGRCAIGFAAANAATYGGDGGPLVVVGISTGVDVAVGEGFVGPWRAAASGSDCPSPGGGPVSAVVGVVGSYPDIDATSPEARFTPRGQVAASPEVPVWLIEGRKDVLQVDRAQTESFRDALLAAGHPVNAHFVDDIANLALIGLEVDAPTGRLMVLGADDDRRGLALSAADILAATRIGRS